MDSSIRTNEFKKDTKLEYIFDVINHSNGLQEFSDQSFADCADFYKNIIIIPIPRTGSTYLHQLLASKLEISYPSNLMARFYNLPLIGAYIQSELFGIDYHRFIHYKSKYGTSEGLYQPHEFGYFWTKYIYPDNPHTHESFNFDNNNALNIEALNAVLLRISSIFANHVVYKFAMGIYFMDVLARLENTIFVTIERHDEEIYRSMLTARYDRLGSHDAWWSLRPKNYSELLELSPLEQVKQQVKSLRLHLERARHKLSDRFLTIQYSDLVGCPDDVVCYIKEQIE